MKCTHFKKLNSPKGCFKAEVKVFKQRQNVLLNKEEKTKHVGC